MSTKPGPIERSFDDAHAGTGMLGADVGADQLDLLRGADGRLPHNVFQISRQRGAGRPTGASNTKTKDVARLFQQRWGDPLNHLGSIMATPTDQGVEMLILAEGGRDKEKKLEALCDEAMEMLKRALDEDWSEKRLKVVEKIVDSAERAALALKNKPGDLALKFENLRLMAAKEATKYVHSAMPVKMQIDSNASFRAFFVGQHGSAGGGQAENFKMAADAVNKGRLDELGLQALRLIDGNLLSDGTPVDALTDCDDV